MKTVLVIRERSGVSTLYQNVTRIEETPGFLVIATNYGSVEHMFPLRHVFKVEVTDSSYSEP